MSTVFSYFASAAAAFRVHVSACSNLSLPCVYLRSVRSPLHLASWLTLFIALLSAFRADMYFILVFPAWEFLWFVCLFPHDRCYLLCPLCILLGLFPAWEVLHLADVIHCTVLLPGFFAISISLRGLPVFSLSIGFVPRYRRFIALLYIFSKAATLLQFSRHEKFFGLFVCFLMTDVIYCIPIAFCLLCFRLEKFSLLLPHSRCNSLIKYLFGRRFEM